MVVQAKQQHHRFNRSFFIPQENVEFTVTTGVAFMEIFTYFPDYCNYRNNRSLNCHFCIFKQDLIEQQEIKDLWHILAFSQMCQTVVKKSFARRCPRPVVGMGGEGGRGGAVRTVFFFRIGHF